jgi:hypothetical protein
MHDVMSKDSAKVDKDADELPKPSKDPDEWRVGYRTGAKGGMTCDICRCLVREKPGDGRAHMKWHRSIERGLAPSNQADSLGG